MERSAASPGHRHGLALCRPNQWYRGLPSHSSLDSQLDHLACACRLQNNVDDLLQEPLKIISGLHEHGRLGPASFHINFLCYQQAVRSADLASDQCHEALPDHHHCVLIAIAHVLAGGGSCFEIFNPTVLLASR